MYEICRLLNAKKTKKPRKPSGPRIGIGVTVEFHGKDYVVSRRDERYKNAWFVSLDGKEMPLSIGRDMMKVKK